MIKNKEIKTPNIDELTAILLERRYIDVLGSKDGLEKDLIKIINDKENFDINADLRMFRLNNMTYSGSLEEALSNVNIQNVLSGIKDSGHALIFQLDSTYNSSDFYIGLRKLDESRNVSTENYSQLLKNSFNTNYYGSELEKVDSITARNLFPLDYDFINAITGIPSLKVENDKVFYQGLDRIVDSLEGEEYSIIVVAEPMNFNKIYDALYSVRDMASDIHSNVKTAIQNTKGKSTTNTFGGNAGVNISQAIQNSIGLSSSLASIIPVVAGASAALGPAAPFVTAAASAILVGTSLTLSRSKSNSNGFNFGISASRAKTKMESETIGTEKLDKQAEWAENLCNKYVERLQEGMNSGLWSVGVYVFSRKEVTSIKASNTLKSIYSGKKTYFEPIKSTQLSTAKRVNYELKDALSKYKNPTINLLIDEKLDHPFGEDFNKLSTVLNSEELSLVIPLPRREVFGLSFRETTSFGINIHNEEEKDMEIGNIIHRRKSTGKHYKINKNKLTTHTSIFGVTGSGKTNTCFNILENVKVPFLVIEPAKSEYRKLLNSKEFGDDLLVFTLGNETISRFRLNPFEFGEKTNLLTHIDYLKAIFNSAFPMYASMPFILEEALIGTYLDKGWNLEDSTNIYLKTIDREYLYPTLEDLYNKIDEVVNNKNFHSELDSNYKATLKARIGSLMQGGKGTTLNCRVSTSLDEIMNRPTILELKYFGDDNEKAFIIGLILTKIYEYREENYDAKDTGKLKHVLLIEEAHRLFKASSSNGNDMESMNMASSASETFTNMIAEIREYGEGIIIADQIPTKLLPDIVKNTDLKILHRTVSLDDRNFVGDTMNLTNEQKKEVAILKPGEAVVSSIDEDKPFLVKINEIKDKYTGNVRDIDIKEKMLNKIKVPENIIGDSKLKKPVFINKNNEMDEFNKSMINLIIKSMTYQFNHFIDSIKEIEDILRKNNIDDKDIAWKYIITYTDKCFKEIIRALDYRFYNEIILLQINIIESINKVINENTFDISRNISNISSISNLTKESIVNVVIEILIDAESLNIKFKNVQDEITNEILDEIIESELNEYGFTKENFYKNDLDIVKVKILENAFESKKAKELYGLQYLEYLGGKLI